MGGTQTAKAVAVVEAKGRKSVQEDSRVSATLLALTCVITPELTGSFFRVYASFLDDLERRVQAGQDPQCFARDMGILASKYDFDDAQKYFCGE